KEINIFKASKDLQDYLDRHGITKTFKSKTLENSWNNIHRSTANYGQWAQYWDKAVEDNAKNCNYQESDWTVDKNTAQTEDNFAKFISYKAAKESLLIDQIQADIKNTGGKTKIVVGKDANGKNIEVSYKDLYDNYQKYKEETGKYQNELDNLGISANRAFIYDDVTKAQWFTNLWYKLNGSSSAKTGLNNYTYLNAKEGISEFNNGITNKNRISSDDSKLINSSTWITNALSKGYVNIEMVNNTNADMTLEDIDNPFVFNLKGIKWSGKIYSSVSDITESSNDKAVAKAEAEYQRKNAEINAKDEKFQRKLNQLDTEHNAIQTEYESVKSALNKNLERSYKAFHG
ncbi:hypothetical protein J6N69_04490, partial [bacterium]|nr:hypothetical protein [bacterium]